MPNSAARYLKHRVSSVTWGAGLLLAIFVFGVVVRARAFLEGRSLWLDESYLAVFFIDRSLFGSLTLGLPNNQSAPPGFLFLTEAVVQFLGLSEFSFRLLPFGFGIASLIVAYFFAKNMFPSLLPRVFFLAAMSLSPVLIYYATEFKQYSFDVLAILTVLTVASAKKKPPTWLLATGIFSIAVTSLPGILAIFLFLFLNIFNSNSESNSTRIDSNSISSLSAWKLATPFVLGVAVHVTHIFFVNNVQHSMTAWWRNAGGLPQVRFDEISDYLWYPRAVLNLVSEWSVPQLVSFPRPDVAQVWLWLAPLVLIGLGLVFRGRQLMTLPEQLSILLVLASFALASAGLYPIGGRPSLFLIPPVLLLVSSALQRLLESSRGLVKPVAVLLTFSLLLTPMVDALKTVLNPYDGHDTIWALELIDSKSGNSVAVLTDGPNKNQVRIHQAFGYASNLPVIGISLDSSRELFSLENNAVSYWLLSTYRINEAKGIVQNLGNNGYQVTCEFEKDGTYLVLLELSGGDTAKCSLED